eukprot:UN25988
MEPDYRKFEGVEYDFFSVFGVFFPAVTGIMAGANISGDLINPSENIPKGTLWAVGVSIFTYCIMAIFIGAVAERDGENADGTANTDGGSHNNKLIMTEISAWGPLILCGVYAATLTSALASLVGAPRILMKTAKDGLIDKLKFFAVTNENGDPIRGYFLAYGVSCAFIAIGELNQIAPLITMFFMITYALINWSVFALEFYKSPGWRPAFQHYNQWTALSGAILCVIIMFLANWAIAILSVLIAAGIYKYIEWSDPDVNWGTAMQSRHYSSALSSILRLRKDTAHVKTFRPKFLVLTGSVHERRHLVYFGQTLREFQSLIVYANISIGNYRQNLTKYRDSNTVVIYSLV